VTNLRPGALDRLALDYETVAKVNPRIIYAQNTGFGIKGPDKDFQPRQPHASIHQSGRFLARGIGESRRAECSVGHSAVVGEEPSSKVVSLSH